MSIKTHTVVSSTKKLEGLTFDAADDACEFLIDGLKEITGKTLLPIPDSSLEDKNENVIPLSVGYSSILAKRFNLKDEINPFDDQGKAKFAFKIKCTETALFITASSD